MEYALKEEPEDFKVVERLNRSLDDDGTYLVLRVTKRRWNTEDMIEALAETTPYQRSRFGYAGNKDREAITTQHVSVENGAAEHFASLDITDLDIDVAGYTDAPINLGDLAGNEFDIVVRGVDIDDVDTDDTFVNYFDKQRFSTYNQDVGRRLVRGDYEGAADILADDPYHGDRIKDHLDDHTNDYTTALRRFPHNLLQLFVHAYQSQLWNRAVQRHLDEFTHGDDFPIIGFDASPNDDFERQAIRTILNEEDLTPRSFIIRSIPELSAEGTRRRVYQDIESLNVTSEQNGVRVSFYLAKGSYATMAVKQLLGVTDIVT